MSGPATATAEHLSITEAAALLGICTRTLRRRIAAGNLPVFSGGLDRRKKLLRFSDVEGLREVTPSIHLSPH